MNPFSRVVSDVTWESKTSTMGDFLLDFLDDGAPLDGAKGAYGIDCVGPGLYESIWGSDDGVGYGILWSSGKSRM